MRRRGISNRGLWLEEKDKGGGELVRGDSVAKVEDTCQPMTGEFGKIVTME